MVVEIGGPDLATLAKTWAPLQQTLTQNCRIAACTYSAASSFSGGMLSSGFVGCSQKIACNSAGISGSSASSTRELNGICAWSSIRRFRSSSSSSLFCYKINIFHREIRILQ